LLLQMFMGQATQVRPVIQSLQLSSRAQLIQLLEHTHGLPLLELLLFPLSRLALVGKLVRQLGRPVAEVWVGKITFRLPPVTAIPSRSAPPRTLSSSTRLPLKGVLVVRKQVVARVEPTPVTAAVMGALVVLLDTREVVALVGIRVTGAKAVRKVVRALVVPAAEAAAEAVKGLSVALLKVALVAAGSAFLAQALTAQVVALRLGAEAGLPAQTAATGMETEHMFLADVVAIMVALLGKALAEPEGSQMAQSVSSGLVALAEPHLSLQLMWGLK
jgi:hypothetical protein